MNILNQKIGNLKNQRMINKFIIALVFVCFSFPAFATCFESSFLKQALLKDLGEKSTWIGLAEENIPSPKAIVLFENLKKKSWTIVVYHVERNSMCIVANGNYAHKLMVK